MNPKQIKNKHNDREQELLNGAVRVLKLITGLNVNIQNIEPGLKDKPDTVIKIEVQGEKTTAFNAEVKTTLTNTNMGYIVEQVRRFDKPGIIITEHVTPGRAAQLKELNTAFVDMTGNAYINAPPLFVYVTGCKKAKIPEENKPLRAFRPTGLQTVYTLLCLPKLTAAPYRDIAQAAQVALGTIGWVFYDLKRLGFVVDRGKYGRKLINKKKLLDLWVENYARELRIKQYVGRFTAKNPDWWQNANYKQFGAMLGGEPAAAKLTGYLKPGTVTIYGPRDPHAFLIRHQLIKDPKGGIEIYKKFWLFEYPWNNTDLTPPLLIYADLFANANDRAIETAKIIYDKYIAQIIEKD